jgi:hypothetical protein
LKARLPADIALRWVDAARARLAELEAGFTIEKAKVEAMKARLFARLRAHFQRRDRLRLVIGYRRNYLESLVRQGEEEAGKIVQEYRQAGAQSDREYAETAAALTTVAIMGAAVWLPHSPLAPALGFVALPPLYWPILLATLLCYVVLTQAVKMWLIRKA